MNETRREALWVLRAQSGDRDAMEGTHRRVVSAGWLTVVATLGAYAWLDHIARTSADVRRLIMAAVLALTCLIAWTTFALAVVVIRAGRRILLAVELSAVERGESQ